MFEYFILTFFFHACYPKKLKVKTYQTTHTTTSASTHFSISGQKSGAGITPPPLDIQNRRSYALAAEARQSAR
jgi:hypothetical protein